MYQQLFTDPSCNRRRTIPTDWVFNNMDSEYKVIIVGDGTMAPSELTVAGGASSMSFYNPEPGLVWIRRFRQHYPHIVWLNPISQRDWDFVYGHRSLAMIRNELPMFELSLSGLDAAIKKLLVNR